MKTVTDHAKAIRKELKATLGLSAKDVSVRSSKYTGGSSLNVKIHNPAADYAAVEAIANQAQQIDRCEVSGEILSGGNCFVFVDYSEKAEAALAETQGARLDRIAEVAQNLPQDEIAEVEGVRVWNRGYMVALCNNDKECWINPKYTKTIAAALCMVGATVHNPEPAPAPAPETDAAKLSQAIGALCLPGFFA